MRGTVPTWRPARRGSPPRFRKSTAELLEQWADRPLYPMSLTEIIPGGVTLNPGGYPIFEDGECIGAIGVGGGSPECDRRDRAPAPSRPRPLGAGENDRCRKQPIRTDDAPTPTGPFNQAIRVGNMVFTSGQAGRNRETGKMGDVADQARRCIGNIAADSRSGRHARSTTSSR